MTLHLTNARIPGERGLLGNLINIAIDDGVVTALDFIGHTTSVTLPSAAKAARVVRGDEQIIDLDGRWIMPGLWDAHVHMGQWAQTRYRLDLSDARTLAEVAHRAGERMRAGDARVVGFGWRPAEVSGEISLELLDAATGDVPTFLFSADLHTAWVNSAGFREVDLHATQTGELSEQACFDVGKRVAIVDDDELDLWVDAAAREAAARGVVGIVDFEMASNAAAWRRRVAGGTDVLRVETAIYAEHLAYAIESGMRSGDTIASTNGLVRVGPLKIILDGSLGSQTARCFEPYPDVIGPRARGVLNHSLPELAALMGRGWAAGLEPAVHAIGDEAVAHALDAFEAVECRGTIEHAQLVRPEDLRRFAPAGVAARVQPEHLCDDRDVAERLWAGRTSQAFPLRQMRDAGVEIRFGSDAPVTALDPWQAIQAAVTRTGDDRSAWHAAECLTVDEAIGASVRTHIAVNQPADFAVLDADPLDMPVGELASMSVSATFVGGRATHMAL